MCVSVRLIILQYYALASCNVECLPLSFSTPTIGGTTIAGSNIKANSIRLWYAHLPWWPMMIHDVSHPIYYCNHLLQGRASNSGFHPVEVHDFRWTRKRKTRLHWRAEGHRDSDILRDCQRLSPESPWKCARSPANSKASESSCFLLLTVGANPFKRDTMAISSAVFLEVCKKRSLRMSGCHIRWHFKHQKRRHSEFHFVRLLPVPHNIHQHDIHSHFAFADLSFYEFL